MGGVCVGEGGGVAHYFCRRHQAKTTGVQQSYGLNETESTPGEVKS